ncbi:thioesterase family protein [uncultured Sulfitobacter sp.]|uniref:acyl-CoA thioesterase n=1 Tax=uncultured Sulfitobacter sp. TaxID=191468 RepID=UPI0026280BD7|nr:thioesterase family protein [uncultured Sulfitobacter sp.]
MTLPYHVPLSADQQRAFGIPQPQPLAIADRVRFSELDVLNHVNNVAYLEWFERLRIRYSQEWGISRYDGDADAPRIVIRSGEIRYHAEVRMDEDYVATCGCTAFRNTSYTLQQQIWAGGTLRATFDCILVTLERDGTTRRRLPDWLRTRFTQIDGASG